MKKFIDVEATAQKIYNKYGTHPVYYSNDRTEEGKDAQTDCIVLEMIYDEKRMVYTDVSAFIDEIEKALLERCRINAYGGLTKVDVVQELAKYRRKCNGEG